MDNKRERWELLTAEEKEFLRPIERIKDEIAAKYKYAGKNGTSRSNINELQNKDFRTLCAERGIDIERAKALSEKLINALWYCYFITEVKTKDGQPQSIFSLFTNRYPNKIKPLPPDKFAAFYNAVFMDAGTDPDIAYPAILDGLYLPHEYKYISVGQYETLASIAEIYTDQQDSAAIPHIGGRRIKSLDFPLDKPNNHIWNMLAVTTGGQLRMEFATEKTGSKKEVSVIYSIDFDELKDARITKSLEPFDKRIYTALAALYNAGNETVTLQQIYAAMGYEGTAGKHDREKINNAVVKMAAAKIFIDNAQEVGAGYKYPLYQYEGYLLPMERVDAVVNGDLVESVIHLFREPPMISFARGRKQLTTIDRKLLATPVNKNNTTIAIEDYLLTRIAKARTGKAVKRILYSTIYEEAHLTTSKQRQRAKPQIEKILQHYVACEFISKYTMDTEGITFSVSTVAKLPPKT